MNPTVTSTPLALKYRPQRFADLAGQESVARTLQSAVASGKLKHVYLFSGTRGIGKTSAARIFARAVNCENPQDGEPCNACTSCTTILEQRASDVFEIDAASYTKVDQTREVLAGVVYKPASLRYKVYIIDEAHMLSKSSFNALLKTLEEPPEHVLFVLATTEPEKIIPTVRSRCQKFHFASPGPDTLQRVFTSVLRDENIAYDDDAVAVIVEEANGSVRDGLSLLDQIATAFAEVTREAIQSSLGLVDRQAIADLAVALATRNPGGVLAGMRTLEQYGAQVQILGKHLIAHLKTILEQKVTATLTEDQQPWQSLSLSDMFRLTELVFQAYETALRSPLAFARFEIGLVRASTLAPLEDVLHGKVVQGTPPAAAGGQSEPETADGSNTGNSAAQTDSTPRTAATEPTEAAAPAVESPAVESAEEVRDFKDRAINNPAVQSLVEHFAGSVVAVQDLRNQTPGEKDIH